MKIIEKVEIDSVTDVMCDVCLSPSVSLVVRLVISPKSNPEGAAWSPCATLFCRA